jgi:hypothetical protein
MSVVALYSKTGENGVVKYRRSILLGCSTFPAPTRATLSFSPRRYSTFSNKTISPALVNPVFMPYRDEATSSEIINAIHRAFASGSGHRSLQSLKKNSPWP